MCGLVGVFGHFRVVVMSVAKFEVCCILFESFVPTVRFVLLFCAGGGLVGPSVRVVGLAGLGVVGGEGTGVVGWDGVGGLPGVVHGVGGSVPHCGGGHTEGVGTGAIASLLTFVPHAGAVKKGMSSVYVIWFGPHPGQGLELGLHRIL